MLLSLTRYTKSLTRDAESAIIPTTTKRHAAEQNTYAPFVQHHVLIGQRFGIALGATESVHSG